MNSYKTFKLNSERPGSSAKVYEHENSNYGLPEGSKIPKFPKRTYSLEGKKSSCSSRRSNTRQKASTTSMIPRLEWKKHLHNPGLQDRTLEEWRNIPIKLAAKYDMTQAMRSEFKKQSSIPCPNIGVMNNVNTKQIIIDEDQSRPEIKNQLIVKNPETEAITFLVNSPSIKSLSSLECKVNQDFINFKDNVLKIPEYWTDAGQTATNILKNAISIISKQYPTVEKESFDTEIQNILKATEAVKQQILMKTENIINKATQIYVERNETSEEPGEEDLKKITNKMEELRGDITVRKNVFGDLLKCGNDMKNLIELEKMLRQKGAEKKHKRKKLSEGTPKKDDENVIEFKCVEIKKNKKGNLKNNRQLLRSCEDALYTKIQPEILDENSDHEREQTEKEDKDTQTLKTWLNDLEHKEKILSELNQQIIELQQLCKDHISKFKSFNLQIKLRGICNKAQHISVSKELQILNDEKMQLEEKNSQLECYNKDLETAIKQKDLDLHQKDKLINQQKKLLQVRDELIEMLKSRCNLEESKHY